MGKSRRFVEDDYEDDNNLRDKKRNKYSERNEWRNIRRNRERELNERFFKRDDA